MRSLNFSVVALLALVLWVGACATPQSQFFETPPGRIPMSDQKLFSKAVVHLKKGQIESAIGLFEKFLQKHPDSFEARSNLGLAFYANDQISQAVSQFEQGIDLEPGPGKIKDNLLRALKVRVAIREENKEFDDAITDLKRISELSPLADREKIGRKIEGYEDEIFEQVKKTDILEEYQTFLEKYPDSPKNSDEVRLRVKELQEKLQQDMASPLSSIRDDIVSEFFAPEMVPEMEAAPPLATIEILPETDQPSEPAPSVMTPQPVVSSKPAPLQMARPEPMSESAPPLSPKMVEVVKAKTLNVRSKPEIKTNNVVYKLKMGARVTYLGENDKWYQVEYAKDKSGWIFKGFSKLLE